MKRQVSLIIFYTEDKKILLQDRTFRGNPQIEWGFFGGGIEEGEIKEQALIRETKEELTYDLKEYKYIGTRKTYVPSIDKEIEAYIFISPLEDINNFKQKEGDGMTLVSIEEARKLKMCKEIDFETLDIIEKYFDNL